MKSSFSFLSVEEEDRVEEEHGNALCCQLLDTIRNSVMTFRPSKSLSCLTSMNEKNENDSKNDRPIAEIDIVISGGGLKGYFLTGCSHVLKHELQKQNVGIARIAGASAGAWCALFMLTDLPTADWLETYYLSKERRHLTMHEAYNDMWPWMESHLPDNAWEICTGRLFISVTEVTVFGFKNHMISEFKSNRDLFDTCLASSTVPYISLPDAFKLYRDMWVVDGGITNNTPIFTDNLRRQLVFRLSDVFYPFRLLINPDDHCIESLVVRGAILMSRFLQGEESDSFSWVYPKNHNSFLDYDDETLVALENNTEALHASRNSWNVGASFKESWGVVTVAVLVGGVVALGSSSEERRSFIDWTKDAAVKLVLWR